VSEVYLTNAKVAAVSKMMFIMDEIAFSFNEKIRRTQAGSIETDEISVRDLRGYCAGQLRNSRFPVRHFRIELTWGGSKRAG
jgi:hypothetical protein